MAGMPYLTQRGEIFWFRTRLSRDLIAIIGRKEVSRSLGTADAKVARRRLALVLVRWHEMVDVIGNDASLSREQVNALVKDFVQTELEKFEGLRRTVSVASELSPTLQEEIASQSMTRRRLVRSIADDRYVLVQALFDEFLEARGVRLDRSAAT